MPDVGETEVWVVRETLGRKLKLWMSGGERTDLVAGHTAGVRDPTQHRVPSRMLEMTGCTGHLAIPNTCPALITRHVDVVRVEGVPTEVIPELLVARGALVARDVPVRCMTRLTGPFETRVIRRQRTIRNQSMVQKPRVADQDQRHEQRPSHAPEQRHVPACGAQISAGDRQTDGTKPALADTWSFEVTAFHHPCSTRRPRSIPRMPQYSRAAGLLDIRSVWNESFLPTRDV